MPGFGLADRRLLLKAGVGTVFGLISGSSFADIVEVPKETDPDVSQPGNATLLAAQVRLGANLVRQLANEGKHGANVVVSPASLATILAFVDLGASEPMRVAIRRTIGFEPAAERRARNDLKALRKAVATTIGNGVKDGPLVSANLLVFDPSTKPWQSALLALSGAGAEVLVDDLAAAKTIEHINKWVRQKTNDLIPSIVDEAPDALGLVAVNALYFKDRWKTAFDPARTQIEPFQSLLGKPFDVPMMHSPVGTFAFRQDDRFIAAELPYANEDFKLVVITTKSAPAAARDFAAVASWLAGQDFDLKKGEVRLPKLSLAASDELLSPLDALGLGTARLAPGSLSGFSSRSLAITGIAQKLNLSLSEEGTEAAAATAVTSIGRALHMDDHVKMIVDKPFVFALRDQRTGLILFMGQVDTPEQIASNKPQDLSAPLKSHVEWQVPGIEGDDQFHDRIFRD